VGTYRSICVKFNEESVWYILVIFYFIHNNPRVLKMLLIYRYTYYVHGNIIFRENNLEEGFTALHFVFIFCKIKS